MYVFMTTMATTMSRRVFLTPSKSLTSLSIVDNLPVTSGSGKKRHRSSPELITGDADTPQKAAKPTYADVAAKTAKRALLPETREQAPYNSHQSDDLSINTQVTNLTDRVNEPAWKFLRSQMGKEQILL